MSDGVPSFPPPADEHPLRGRVLDALADVGLAPNLDGDGDVEVVVERQRLFVRCTDTPLPVMRVFGQWRIAPEVPGDELARLRAAGRVTARLNLVHLSVHGPVLLSAVDQLVPAQAPLGRMLQVACTAVIAGVRAWHVEAGGEVAADDDPARDDG